MKLVCYGVFCLFVYFSWYLELRVSLCSLCCPDLFVNSFCACWVRSDHASNQVIVEHAFELQYRIWRVDPQDLLKDGGAIRTTIWNVIWNASIPNGSQSETICNLDRSVPHSHIVKLY